MQSFLEASPVQKGFFPSHKLQDHAYEQQNPLELNKINPQLEIARIN